MHFAIFPVIILPLDCRHRDYLIPNVTHVLIGKLDNKNVNTRKWVLAQSKVHLLKRVSHGNKCDTCTAQIIKVTSRWRLLHCIEAMRPSLEDTSASVLQWTVDNKQAGHLYKTGWKDQCVLASRDVCVLFFGNLHNAVQPGCYKLVQK